MFKITLHLSQPKFKHDGKVISSIGQLSNFVYNQIKSGMILNITELAIALQPFFVDNNYHSAYIIKYGTAAIEFWLKSDDQVRKEGETAIFKIESY